MTAAVPCVHVVDDDADFRTALVRMLTASGYAVLSYASGEDFLARGSHSCGCVVADLRMPDIDGLALQEACARADVTMPFVFLTGHADVPSAVSALKHGALDFLDKCAPREALLGAIRGALERDLTARHTRGRQELLQLRLAALSERERQVLALVVRGRMNKQIAAELAIHERTVKLHRTAITSKLGVRSVAELTTLVRETQSEQTAGILLNATLPQRVVPPQSKRLLASTVKVMVNIAETVAIVDDDESVRRSLARMLQGFGFHSQSFASAEEFLAAAAPKSFSCLLLDLQMEGMSGLELVRELVRRGSRVPIIVITAHSEPELRQQLLQHGCAAFFRKTDPAAMIIAELRRVTCAGAG